MTGQVLDAGCKELLFWKLLYAVTCSVLLQIVLFIAFLFITNLSVLHPVVWVQLTFATLTSVSTWLLLVPLACIIFAQGVMCSKEYIFEAAYRTNRIQQCLGVLSLRNLVTVCLHLATGALMVWLYLILLGRYVYEPCDASRHCLNEPVLFLVLNGLWIGLFYCVKRSLTTEQSIVFPVIQQRKWLTVKANIGERLKQAMGDAVWPTLYFVLIYYYRGTALRDWCVEHWDWQLDNEPLHLVNVLGSWLPVYAWFFSALFVFTMLSMRLFFEVFLTEHWPFPIECESRHVLTLGEALAMSRIPIVQHLACLDLYTLALWYPLRRKQLFTLSQPGGHPRNWNGVLHEVLQLVTDFSTEINRATEAILAPAEPTPVPESVAEKLYQGPASDVVPPTTTLYSPVHSPNGLRNMSLPRPEPLDIVHVTKNELLTETVAKVKESAAGKLQQVVASIKRKPVVRYFFGDMPESRIHFLLSKGQPIIWAIQGLSFMATASFTEDSYGVVQKDLPVILTSLVTLKQHLDKLHKVSIVNRKSTRCELFQTQLKTALRSAVRRSLYNICNTFGEYLPQMQLSREVQQQLQAFVHFKEG